MIDPATSTTTTTTSSTPKPIKDDVIDKTFDTPTALIAREEFEAAKKWIDERILNTNYIMGVIIVVLFIGFITLLISVIGIWGQYIGVKTNSEYELRQSINKLIDTVNTVDKIVSTVTPVPTSIPVKQ